MVINVGSRDESPAEQGLAHFIEHVIFKGTHRRKSFHIMSHMENVGGEINAYTTKEETCIYGSFMPPYYERWFDVVSDITLQSSFPPKELLKEKDIVIDEINSYKDTPSEQIIDDFDEILYDGHPLGRNILGTPAHLKAFSRENILHFIQKHYVGEEMVICSVAPWIFSAWFTWQKNISERCFRKAVTTNAKPSAVTSLGTARSPGRTIRRTA